MSPLPVRHPDLGDRIRSARKRSGLSHDRLAERAGTSRSHLIKLEKGWHRPGPELLARIAEATGTPLEEFADDDDEESDQSVNLDDVLRSFLRRLIREEAGRVTA